MSKGISNSNVRIENTVKVTKTLYECSKLTRQNLCHKLGLSLPTINVIIAQLESDGLVIRQSAQRSSGGRIPDLVCFNYDAFYSVGCEITQNYFKILLINLHGNILCEKTIRKQFSADQKYWENIEKEISNMVIYSNIPDTAILGVGLAVPGIVNHDNKVIELAPTIGLKDFPIRKISTAIHYPLIVENEANAAGFSEVWFRSDITQACYLSITKGVGGALISDNHIEFGTHFRCGEFGHMTLVPFGKKCNCGKQGCFEAYCSTRVLSSCCNSNIDDFFNNLNSNSQLQKIWNEYLEYLAVGISNICIAFDRPVILGGELGGYIENDLERLNLKIAELIPFIDHSISQVSLSRYGKNAAAIGSAFMMFLQAIPMSLSN